MTSGHFAKPLRSRSAVVFQSMHRFAGIAVGENLFFLLEGLWAICLSIHLYRHRLMAMPMIAIPGLSGALILVYSLEQFGGVFTGLAPLNVLAHAALVFWFIALASMLIGGPAALDRGSRPRAWVSATLMIGYLAIVGPGFVA